MQLARIARVALLLSAIALVGCGPSIIVRHLDPTYPVVDVRVDNEPVATIEYGEEVEVGVEAGTHFVEAFPRGEDVSPWAPDGRGWVFYVDRRAFLTLLQEGATPDGSD